MYSSSRKRQSRSLNILQWNCRSILRKLPEFKNYLNNLKIIPDIICLQETFLNYRYNPQIVGYTMLRKDRGTPTGGGGIAILIRNNIYFTELRIIDTEWQGVEEIMGIQVEGLNIINFYNKPSNIFSVNLLNFLSTFNSAVICGDFNAHHPTWGSAAANSSGSNLVNFLNDGNHVLLNLSVPTHLTITDKIQWSLLDLTMVSSQMAGKSNTNITHEFLGSDHSVIITTINDFEIPTKLHIPKWNFGRADWPAYYNQCLTHVHENLISTNIDRFSEQLTESFLAVATATIPQTKPRNKNLVPWWTKSCAVAVRNKKHACNRMMRTRHPLDILTYKRLRAKTRKVILQAKRDCWQQYCNSVNSNTKLTTVWKALKKFSGNNCNFYMPALKNNDNTAETDHEKANLLADQFHSVSSTANYSIDFLSNRGDLEAILSYHLQRLSSYSCKDYRINQWRSVT